MAGACAEEGPAADGVLGGAGWPVAAGAGGASQSPLAGAGGPVAGARADAECRLGKDCIRAGGTAGAWLRGGGGGKPVATEAGRVGWPLARGSGGVVAAFFAGTHANIDSQTGHMTPLQGSVDGWTPFSSIRNACVIQASSADSPTQACTNRSLQWPANAPRVSMEKWISSCVK